MTFKRNKVEEQVEEPEAGTLEAEKTEESANIFTMTELSEDKGQDLYEELDNFLDGSVGGFGDIMHMFELIEGEETKMPTSAPWKLSCGVPSAPPTYPTRALHCALSGTRSRLPKAPTRSACCASRSWPSSCARRTRGAATSRARWAAAQGPFPSARPPPFIFHAS